MQPQPKCRPINKHLAFVPLALTRSQQKKICLGADSCSLSFLPILFELTPFTHHRLNTENVGIRSGVRLVASLLANLVCMYSIRTESMFYFQNGLLTLLACTP